MTKIKICGLRRTEDIVIVNRYLPDFAGFILAENRKRTVSAEQLALLGKQLHPEIQKVAVFVNQDPSFVASIYNQGLIDYVQLHGQEDEVYIHLLRKKAPGIRIIRAFSICDPSDVTEAECSSADLILLDHGRGGTGSSFDWKLIQGIHRKFILAGGLNPENIHKAITLTHPWAADVSSGVETDGVKDEQKIKSLIQTVREGEKHE